MDTQQIDVMVADASHEVYVDTILETIRNAAAVRGTGIAERTHEYVATKMKEGKAIIALCGDTFAGFTYIESWGNKQYVATSGLIVHPDFRGLGLAKRIKQASFQLARLRWPKAKIFSLTSGAAEYFCFRLLKGDMSLVGPRPERKYFIERIVRKAPFYYLLHNVRPGITSLGMVKSCEK